MDIVRRSSETDDHCELFMGLMRESGCTASIYMYNILSMYMTNYIPLPDAPLSTLEHNQIYSEFERSVQGLDMCTIDVLSVSHIDNVHSSMQTGLNNGFCSSMYDDAYRCLADYYGRLHGENFIAEHFSDLNDDLERLIEMTCYTAKEIEACYLDYRSENNQSYVLFGMKENHLVVLVH